MTTKTIPSFTIHTQGGQTFGPYPATSARAALDALAGEAGYDSHEASCRVTGAHPGDWTTDRVTFKGGTSALLVVEA